MTFRVLIPLLPLTALAAAAQAPAVSGDYLEARTNHVHGCYCEWSGESITGGKEAILAWSFRTGEYRGVPLSPAIAAAVIVGEKTLSIGDPPRKTVLVLDSQAPEPSRRAAERFLRDRYERLLGKILRVQELPIQFEREAARARVQVGELVRVNMRKAVLPEDGLPGAILWFDPFIPLEESTIGTTLNERYWGKEFNYQWETNDAGTTGYFGRFVIPHN